MNEEYVKALTDVVKTFLSFSDVWLEDEVIDKETYAKITREKRKFMKGMQLKQG